MTMTMTQEQKKASQTFAMPKATVGQLVLWHPEGVPSGRPFPALVLNVSTRTLDLAVLSPNGLSKSKTGVRHYSDPAARQIEFQESGAWGETDETKRLRELELAVAELSHNIA